MYEFIKEGPNRIIQQASRSTFMKELSLMTYYTCSIEQGLSVQVYRCSLVRGK